MQCLHCDIRHMAVCGALDAAAIAELQTEVRHMQFAGGQTIVVEGEPAEAGFIVLTGMVSLYKGMPDGRRQIVGFLLPGDFLGITRGGSYCHSAEAVISTELCRLSSKTLARMADRYPEFQHRLMGALAAEVCAAQERMLWLGRKSALERVASFLVALARNSERRGGRANDISLPMTRQEIADCLGMTEATVIRGLGGLARRGLIWVARPHEIVILRREALEAIAEGTTDQGSKRARRCPKAEAG